MIFWQPNYTKTNNNITITTTTTAPTTTREMSTEHNKQSDNVSVTPPSSAKGPPYYRKSVLPQITTPASFTSQNQETLFKLFTYTVILLPTLTSILFPINSNNIPRNEQIGNFIIDLLTVVLISWVVRFTIEWPYNWMKQLQNTKTKLLKQLKPETEKKEGYRNQHRHGEIDDKVILLIRKISTFEIIALLCCLLSSIFSSTLLIWTRQYTIIDQQRKKMVFNNVNIALLQFCSIFRIIITFTDLLQSSSLNNSQINIQNSDFQGWFQDLRHYFLPNLTNQILLDHLQSHNKQFDKLKLDLARLECELQEKTSADPKRISKSMTPPIEIQRTNYSKNKKLQLSLQLQRQPHYFANAKTPSELYTNSISPFPLNVSHSASAWASVSATASPSSSTTPTTSSSSSSLPAQTKIDQLQSVRPSIVRRRSTLTMGKKTLKTIAEEDDHYTNNNVDNNIVKNLNNGDSNGDGDEISFESIGTPSFSKFATPPQVNHSQTHTSFSQNVSMVLKSIKNEVTLQDIFKNPQIVRKILMSEITPLINQLQLYDYEILKTFLVEVIDKYLLGLYVVVMEQFLEVTRHPARNMMYAIYFAFVALPIYGIKCYFKILLLIPRLVFRWTVLRPINFIGLIIYTMVSMLPFRNFLSRLVRGSSIKTKTPSSKMTTTNTSLLLPPPLPLSLPPLPNKTMPNTTASISNLLLENLPRIKSQFTMKQFHLSPTLDKGEFPPLVSLGAPYHESINDNNNNHLAGSRMYKSSNYAHTPLISVMPSPAKPTKLARKFRYDHNTTAASLYDNN